jgi:hypothetical protein
MWFRKLISSKQFLACQNTGEVRVSDYGEYDDILLYVLFEVSATDATTNKSPVCINLEA